MTEAMQDFDFCMQSLVVFAFNLTCKHLVIKI